MGWSLSSSYPEQFTPYYASLMGERSTDDPVARQILATADEDSPAGSRDPLGEDSFSPLPGLIHAYRDRVVLMPTGRCAVNCRHCNRRWKRKMAPEITPELLQEWVAYLRGSEGVDELLITGGDPLLLSDEQLEDLLVQLRRAKPDAVLRIGSRMPVVLPSRITRRLCALFARFQPVYLHTQFNCPAECTPQAGEALARLADAGVNLGNQMVLLRGVNDDAGVIGEVNRWLVRHRCRPYYLFLTERVEGTAHFWVSATQALAIAAELRRVLSGIAMPNVVVDTPDAGGKVPLTADNVGFAKGEAVVTDLRGRSVKVRDSGGL